MAQEHGQLKGVDIFAAGTWNGDEYSTDDLDKIVSSFNQTKEKLKPYLKLGHGNDQKILREDELPAAGFVDRIYREGRKILADISNIPNKIYELIKKKAYDKVSIELYKDIPIDGTIHEWALKAIALLGGATPAVHDLDSIMALYGNNTPILAFENNTNVRSYAFDLTKFNEEENKMELEELNKKLEVMEEEMKVFKEANATLTDENNKLKTELEEVKKFSEDKKKELDTIYEEKRTAEIEAKIKNFIDDKKIVPAQAEKLKVIFRDLPKEKKFTVGDKEFNSMEELLISFISEGKAETLPTDEKSEMGGNPNLDEDAVIRNYMAKNNVSYKDAYVATAAGKQ